MDLYLDADTVPVEKVLDNNVWVLSETSKIMIEEVMNRDQVGAGQQYNCDQKHLVSNFIIHPKITNPIPRSKRSLELKLARMVTKRLKKDRCRLWDTLAPGILGSSPHNNCDSGAWSF